jgi:hypothetical protein
MYRGDLISAQTNRYVSIYRWILGQRSSRRPRQALITIAHLWMDGTHRPGLNCYIDLILAVNHGSDVPGSSSPYRRTDGDAARRTRWKLAGGS